MENTMRIGQVTFTHIEPNFILPEQDGYILVQEYFTKQMYVIQTDNMAHFYARAMLDPEFHDNTFRAMKSFCAKQKQSGLTYWYSPRGALRVYRTAEFTGIISDLQHRRLLVTERVNNDAHARGYYLFCITAVDRNWCWYTVRKMTQGQYNQERCDLIDYFYERLTDGYSIDGDQFIMHRNRALLTENRKANEALLFEAGLFQRNELIVTSVAKCLPTIRDVQDKLIKHHQQHTNHFHVLNDRIFSPNNPLFVCNKPTSLETPQKEMSPC
jgi:hypothetical protein